MSSPLPSLPYAGWPHCVRLTNETYELIATTDVGPRIIRFGFVGGPNEFVEYPDQLGKAGGTDYHSYGGHRLWVAPETKGWTNHPDNQPVQAEENDGALVLTAPVEHGTLLQKQVRVSSLPGPAGVRIEHRVTNHGKSAVRLAPWALSVMAPGGIAVVPHERFIPHETHVLPARPLVLWHYTDMTDRRWGWGTRLFTLRQETTATSPQKVGMRVSAGWMAYLHGDRLFIKRFPHEPTAEYTDFGCNAEIFTNSRMLELESLGPLVELPPDGTISHTEHWYLTRGIVWPKSENEQLSLLTQLVAHTTSP